uniref:Retrotransposon protein, putative, unclassified n=1 Tax=Oryza sativa subsp. japonica TaxID=39947 RepID=Q2QU61_ORYSJ|nr:retrotransposon protein, putative, unclassified [Oryza sativa Japonica Group]
MIAGGHPDMLRVGWSRYDYGNSVAVLAPRLQMVERSGPRTTTSIGREIRLLLVLGPVGHSDLSYIDINRPRDETTHGSRTSWGLGRVYDYIVSISFTSISHILWYQRSPYYANTEITISNVDKYRKFNKDFGLIGKPLFTALKKTGFTWQDEQQQAFATIKDKLAHAPVLAMPNYTQPFILLADASDQASLKYINEQRLTKGIQHKLLIKLLNYNYKIEYKKGKENKAADALSRIPFVAQWFSTTIIVPTWIIEILASYATDPKCTALESQLRITPQGHPSYTLTGGILRYKNRLYVGAGTDLRAKLQQSFHDSALGGHSGERATYQRAKLLFYWPGMKKDIASYVKLCPVCQKNKSEHNLQPGLLHPLPVPEMAWTHISMDFIEGLPKSDNKDVIWVIVDRFTKYAHFVALSHPFTADQIVTQFVENYYKHHGLPAVIVSDRDIIFTSQTWKDVFEKAGVKLHFSSGYHLQTDGQTERVNQCLENYLCCMTFTKPKKWKSLLAYAEWWYNTSFHTALGMTPYQAIHGVPPPLLAESLLSPSLFTDARNKEEAKSVGSNHKN